MSTKVGDIFVNATLDTKKYKKDLAGLQSISERAGNLIGGKLKSAIAGIGLAMATKAMWSFAQAVAGVGDTIDKQSQKLGMSSKAYQEWDYVMQRCGASIDSMTAGMRTLSSMAEQGSDAFQELGISQAELQSLSQEQLFERTVTALQNVDDKTRRTYLSSKLLGRGSMELGALLNMSAEDTAKLRNNLTSLGGVMSETAVRNSAVFKDTLTDISMALRSIYNTFAEYVLPKLTAVLNNYVIPVIQKIGQAFRWLMQLLSGIGRAFSGVGKIFGGIKAGVAKAFGKDTQKDTAKSATSIGKVSDAVGGTGKSAKGAKKQVQALKRELLGFDQIVKLTAQDAGTGGGGAGGGVGGLGGMDLGGLDDTTSKLQDIADRINNILSKIQIPSALKEAVGKLAESFGSLWDVLREHGAWVLENVLKPLGEWFMDSALPSFITTLSVVVGVLAKALDALCTALETLWGWLQKIVRFLEEKGLTEDKLKKMPAFGMFGMLFGQGGDSEELGQSLFGGSSVEHALDNLFGDPTKTNNSLTSIGKNIDILKGKINSLPNKTISIGVKDSATSVVNKVKNGLGSINRTFTPKLKLNKSSFATSWNALARKFNNARAGATGLAKSMLPKLPYLAQGGYVKANTPQLAVVGDNRTQGEIIAPEGKLAEMARQASGNPQMISLLTQILNAIQNQDRSVYLDGKQIADNTVSHINRQTRQTGKLSLVI